RRQIGFIAQDVEKVFPELVFEDSEGIKSLDYSKFTPVLLQAIKEQQQQIEKLQQENEELKRANEKYTSEI
ncbi:MAG: tail fiber domain-containing protein, partial [Fervidobacterium pennivorans]